jgi:alpha-L-rhamnosidase
MSLPHRRRAAAALAAAAAATVAAAAAPPPRLLPPPPGGADPLDLGYAYLNGGTWTGASVADNPDPIQTYVWGPGVDASKLQVFYLLPATAALTDGTAPGGFAGWESLTMQAQAVTVSGAGGIAFDFGENHAAWVEFDSPDLSAADAAGVTLGLSEYNEVGIFNTGLKQGPPVPHPAAAGAGITTWRLETNPGIYEGVRFAWLNVSAAPAAPWHISALRLVVQIKPTNWAGAFSAPGDGLLTRLWYIGAYTTKVNLLSDQFGAILMYRGDRFLWAGDVFVSQRTALAAFDDVAFVGTDVNFTKTHTNGIESYALLFVLSVADYYDASGDAAAAAYLAPYVEPLLEHAHTIWPQSAPALGFYGWDDRLGSGFNNASCAEAVAAYRSLAIRAWREWARVVASAGTGGNATHWTGYADAAVNATRAAGADWWAPLGLFAAADALASGVATPEEAPAIIAARMNDAVTVCGLSAFNTYTILEALAVAGDLDRGVAVIHRCWDVMVVLGGTTTWETSSPDWALALDPTDAVPGFEDGFTSLAHPWASGPTPWASKWLVGVRPTAPGFAAVAVAPHIAGAMEGVAGTVPTRHGGIRVNATRAGRGGAVRVHVPPGVVSGVVEVSAVLAARLGAPSAVAAGGLTLVVRHDAGVDAEACARDGLPLGAAAGAAAEVPWAVGAAGPVDPATGARSPVAVVPLAGPGCTVVELVPAGHHRAEAPPAAVPDPFPPISYPATFVGRDAVTAGSWLGTYGSAGYVLFAYDGPNQHVVNLPPWVSAVTQTFGHASNGPWPTDGSDPRALVDPRNASAPRKIGQYCVSLPWASGWDPSFPFDITLTPGADGVTPYQVAVYVVDFDFRGRRQAVSVMDGRTLAPIAPVEFVMEGDFVRGVWLVWRYNASIRFRFNFIRGDNQVVSAFAFDNVTDTAGGGGRG